MFALAQCSHFAAIVIFSVLLLLHLFLLLFLPLLFFLDWILLCFSDCSGTCFMVENGLEISKFHLSIFCLPVLKPYVTLFLYCNMISSFIPRFLPWKISYINHFACFQLHDLFYFYVYIVSYRQTDRQSWQLGTRGNTRSGVFSF